MPTIAVSDATFEDQVMRNEKPVLVDFWAPWCAPCRQVGPILEELSETFANDLVIAKVNVDESPVLSQALRIQSIPTMILFDKGRPLTSVKGALPRESLIEFIESNVPTLKKPTVNVEELDQLLQQGAPVVLFDVRAQNDYSRSHLRHAKCAPPDQLKEALAEVDPQSLVVLICRTGEVSAELAQSFAGGPHRVVALEKGLLEWEGSGKPTYNDREEAELDAGNG